MIKIQGIYVTPDRLARIKWNLTPKSGGHEFSASGSYDGGGGQVLESIADAYPNDTMITDIVSVWRKYHLNGMKPGLPEQERAIAEWVVNGNTYDYERACHYLGTLALYEIKIPPGVRATGGVENPLFYKYGTRWIFSPIPTNVLNKIRAWPKVNGGTP